MSRTVVTPKAGNQRRNRRGSPSFIHGPNRWRNRKASRVIMCVWRSTRPGIRKRPRAGRISASRGTRKAPRGPTARIVPSTQRTDEWVRGGAPEPSNTVASSIASAPIDERNATTGMNVPPPKVQAGPVPSGELHGTLHRFSDQAQQRRRDADLRTRGLAGPGGRPDAAGREGLARGRLPAHRHREVLRERGGRRDRGAGERDPEGRGLHHDEALELGPRVRDRPQGVRGEPEAARLPDRGPVPDPLARPRPPEGDVEGTRADPEGWDGPRDWREQLHGPPPRGAPRGHGGRARRQPDRDEPGPVSEGRDRVLQETRDRRGGVQPAHEGPPHQRSAAEGGRSEVREDRASNPDPMGTPARVHRDPEVLPPRAHQGERASVRFRNPRGGHAGA